MQRMWLVVVALVLVVLLVAVVMLAAQLKTVTELKKKITAALEAKIPERNQS